MKSIALMVIVLAGCAHLTEAERQEALRRSLAAIDPAAEPRAPEKPPADGHPQFNAEYWLGSEAEEAARFIEFGRQIQALQGAAAQKHGQPIARGFHAKAHGCVHGELRLADDRDPRTRHGLFADGQPARPVWIRFSNGVGWRQGDRELDARGMAVKVMEVPGDKYLPTEKTTQDFLMTNAPTPVGKNAEEFMVFAHANAKGLAAGLFFLFGHPRTGAALLRTGAINSMSTEQYWSGGAYHLGAHQAIKFTAKPCPGTPPRKPSRKSGDYLHEDLAGAAKQGLCMSFYVQFQYDPEQTPIENASVEWKEKVAPLVHVGDLVAPPQDIDLPATRQLCDGLSYNPWHSIAAHKPMGHINRARRVVYSFSAERRNSQPEPAPWSPAPAAAIAP